MSREKNPPTGAGDPVWRSEIEKGQGADHRDDEPVAAMASTVMCWPCGFLFRSRLKIVEMRAYRRVGRRQSILLKRDDPFSFRRRDQEAAHNRTGVDASL